MLLYRGAGVPCCLFKTPVVFVCEAVLPHGPVRDRKKFLLLTLGAFRVLAADSCSGYTLIRKEGP